MYFSWFLQMLRHLYDSEITLLYSYDFQANKTYFIILTVHVGEVYIFCHWKLQGMDDIEVQIRAYVNSAAYTKIKI